MNLSTDAKHLIDRYATEVGSNMPKKLRPEIVVEIRSLILDSIDDRCEMEDRSPDEEMVIEILKELGPPYQMAGSYQPKNYLIGPKVFMPFWLTIRGTWAFITFFFTIFFIIDLAQITPSWQTISQTLGSFAWEYVQNLFTAFSWVIISFVILERVLPNTDWSTEVQSWPALARVPILRQFLTGFRSEDWEPTTLKIEQKESAVKRSDIYWEIGVLIFALIMGNFFAHWVGIFGSTNETSWFIPILSENYTAYLVWWNLYWVAMVGLNVYLLGKGYWEQGTRWLHLGMLIFSGLLVLSMVLGPSIIGLNSNLMAKHELTTSTIEMAENTIIPVAKIVVQVIFILHLIPKTFIILGKGYKLFRESSTQTWEPTNNV